MQLTIFHHDVTLGMQNKKIKIYNSI